MEDGMSALYLSVPYHMDTDASVVAISGILQQYQMHEGELVLKVIAYGSRGLQPTEIKYGAPKLEMLAAIYFIESFDKFLSHKTFLLRCDNHALSWLKTYSNTDGMTARWITRLGRFHFRIQHRMREKHTNADGMSKIPVYYMRHEDRMKDIMDGFPFLDQEQYDELPLLGEEEHWCIGDPRWDNPPATSEQEEKVLDQQQGSSSKVEVRDVPTEAVMLQPNLDKHGQVLNLHTIYEMIQERSSQPNEEDDDTVSVEDLEAKLTRTERQHNREEDRLNAIKLVKRYGTKDLREAQDQDVKLRAVKRLLRGPPPGLTDKQYKSQCKEDLSKADKKWFHKNAHFFKLSSNGVLMVRAKGTTEQNPLFRIIIPAAFKNEVIRWAHDIVGHLGETRIRNAIWDRFDWPTVDKDVKKFVASCPRCQRGKPSQRIAKKPLIPIVTMRPNQLVEVDFETLCATPTGEIGMLVIIDHFTKYARAYPVKAFTAKVAARILFKHWIMDFGAPETLQSDRGSQFESNLFNELLTQWEITRTHSTPYHPQTNGLVERQNRTLVGIMRVTCSRYKSNWPRFVSSAVFAYNATRHATTSYTPNMLMTGREVSIPLDLLIPAFREKNPAGMTYTEYITQHQRVMEQCLRIARHNTKQANIRSKRNYDKKARWMQHLAIGQHAMVFVDVVKKEGTKKLEKQWRGPFKLLATKMNGAVLCFKTKKGKSFTAAYEKVRPYHSRIIDLKPRMEDGEFDTVGATSDAITIIHPTEGAETEVSEWSDSWNDRDACEGTTLSEPSFYRDHGLRQRKQGAATRNPNYISPEGADDPNDVSGASTVPPTVIYNGRGHKQSSDEPPVIVTRRKRSNTQRRVHRHEEQMDTSSELLVAPKVYENITHRHNTRLRSRRERDMREERENIQSEEEARDDEFQMPLISPTNNRAEHSDSRQLRRFSHGQSADSSSGNTGDLEGYDDLQMPRISSADNTSHSHQTQETTEPYMTQDTRSTETEETAYDNPDLVTFFGDEHDMDTTPDSGTQQGNSEDGSRLSPSNQSTDRRALYLSEPLVAGEPDILGTEYLGAEVTIPFEPESGEDRVEREEIVDSTEVQHDQVTGDAHCDEYDEPIHPRAQTGKKANQEKTKLDHGCYHNMGRKKRRPQKRATYIKTKKKKRPNIEVPTSESQSLEVAMITAPPTRYEWWLQRPYWQDLPSKCPDVEMITMPPKTHEQRTIAQSVSCDGRESADDIASMSDDDHTMPDQELNSQGTSIVDYDPSDTMTEVETLGEAQERPDIIRRDSELRINSPLPPDARIQPALDFVIKPLPIRRLRTNRQVRIRTESGDGIEPDTAQLWRKGNDTDITVDIINHSDDKEWYPAISPRRFTNEEAARYPTRYVKIITRRDILRHTGALMIDIPRTVVLHRGIRTEITQTYDIDIHKLFQRRLKLGQTVHMKCKDRHIFFIVARNTHLDDLNLEAYADGLKQVRWMASELGIEEINTVRVTAGYNSSIHLDIKELYRDIFADKIKIVTCMPPSLFEIPELLVKLHPTEDTAATQMDHLGKKPVTERFKQSLTAVCRTILGKG